VLLKLASRLEKAKSPYLRYHASNPVDWYPWGSKAIDAAKKLDRPLFISIGYLSCHWCHRMNDDIFMDTEIAELMNRFFVNIIVDREERPDVDEYFISLAQRITDNVGWPLNVLATADLRPFLVFTYLPKYSEMGHTGFLDLIKRVNELWASERSRLIAADFTFERVSARGQGSFVVDKTYEFMKRIYDKANGGFGFAPKFPMPVWLSFLLYYGWRTRTEEPLNMCKKSLIKMREGAIYDQLHGGFHRYCVDASWTVPHFEKMLYDQALLTAVYSDSYAITGLEVFKETIQKTISYTNSQLGSEYGGYYSSQGADSNGVEGGYYLWNYEDIQRVIPHDVLEDFIANMTRKIEGNTYVIVNGSLETGKELYGKYLNALAKFRDETGTAPAIDKKVLVDWNGLMVLALSRAYRATREAGYLDLAVKTADYLLRANDASVYHSIVDGEPSVRGFLDDYAYLSWAFLELYGLTFNDNYFEKAKEMCEEAIRRFWSGEAFYYVPEDVDLPVRTIKLNEEVTPNGNSVMLLNMIELSAVTGNNRYREIIKKLSVNIENALIENPVSNVFGALATDLGRTGLREVIIVNEGKPSWAINELANYMPDLRVYFKSEKMKKYLSEYEQEGNQLTIYLCSNGSCSMPMHSLEELKNRIGNKG